MAKHPKHPKCSACGRALYKAKDKGARVRPDDPWAWCRNLACAYHGLDQTATETQARLATPTAKTVVGRPEEQPVSKAKPVSSGKRSKRRRRAAVPSPGRPPSPPVEPEPIQKARARIKELVKKATAGQDPTGVALVLAILNQETGSHAAANKLIAEHQLDKKFGIKPTSGTPKST